MARSERLGSQETGIIGSDARVVSERVAALECVAVTKVSREAFFLRLILCLLVDLPMTGGILPDPTVGSQDRGFRRGHLQNGRHLSRVSVEQKDCLLALRKDLAGQGKRGRRSMYAFHRRHCPFLEATC